MEPRILNFVEAMELYLVLARYEPLIGTYSVFDFSKHLLEKISPQDFLRCLILFSGKSAEYFTNVGGNVALNLFMSGLEINKVELIYKNLGWIMEK